MPPKKTAKCQTCGATIRARKSKSMGVVSLRSAIRKHYWDKHPEKMKGGKKRATKKTIKKAAARISSGATYYCRKCKKRHRKSSTIGRAHIMSSASRGRKSGPRKNPALWKNCAVCHTRFKVPTDATTADERTLCDECRKALKPLGAMGPRKNPETDYEFRATLIDAIEANPGITIQGLAQVLHRPESHFYYPLGDLEAEGWIYSKSQRGKAYYIAEDPPPSYSSYLKKGKKKNPMYDPKDVTDRTTRSFRPDRPYMKVPGEDARYDQASEFFYTLKDAEEFAERYKKKYGGTTKVTPVPGKEGPRQLGKSRTRYVVWHRSSWLDVKPRPGEWYHSQMYYCDRCGRKHRGSSLIGLQHRRYATAQKINPCNPCGRKDNRKGKKKSPYDSKRHSAHVRLSRQCVSCRKELMYPGDKREGICRKCKKLIRRGKLDPPEGMIVNPDNEEC